MDYKKKYIKYKKKYLELKKFEQSGGSNKWEEIKPLPDNKIEVMPISLELFYQLKVIRPKDIKNHLIKNSKNLKSLFKTLFNKIIPEIKNNKINFFIIPLPLSDNNVYWTDYYNSYLNYFYGKKWSDNNFLYMTIRLHNNSEINFNEEIIISYELNIDQSQVVFDIFSKYLPYNYFWSGKSTKTMIIDYKKSKNKIKNINIKETKIYPKARIDIKATFENNPKFIKEFKDNKSEYYNIDPFKEFLNFSEIFREIDKKSDIIDAGWNWSFVTKKISIDFYITGIKNLELITKLSKLKYFEYKNYKFKIISNIKEDYFTLSENEEIKIKDISKILLKKKNRPSPSESATKFKVGTKKKGNDGNMWIIVENKNGVKRWSKIN